MSRCEPWKFWASSAWGIAAVAVWFGVQFLAANALVDLFGMGENGDGLEGIETNAPLVALVTIAAAPAAVAVIWAATRRAGCAFTEYLGLVRPSGRELLFAFACLLVVLPLADLVSYVLGREVAPDFVTGIYRSARDTGTIVLLALAIGIAAPVAEEIVFRGFLLRGYAESDIGAAGGIALSAAAWSLLHSQYDPYHVAHIFVLGALFGWLRLRTGSTLLTIALHGTVNLVALVQAAVIVEWLS